MTEREMFFRYLGLPSLNPIGLEIERAEGIYLYDKTGNQYVDLVSGIAVSNVGHRHPEVIQAIQDQLNKYLHLNVYGEFIQTPQIAFAKKLVSFLPGNLDSVYLINSGSEAIEGAIKLARRFTGRTEIISFRNSYHGSTLGALSIMGDETLKNAFRPLLPDIRILDFNDEESLNSISFRTACVVAETIQAEAGIILPQDDFLKKLRSRCTQSGTLLIVDDVQMGLGRTGKLFSFEQFGIVPDILVLAKALGGGMPLGAFISSQEIMRSLTFNPELGHITTFGGHPVSCASALASLEVLTRDHLLKQAEEKGSLIVETLESHPLIREIRRKGLAIGVEIIDPSLRQKVTTSLLRNGLVIDWYLFHPSTFRIAPPLTITHDQVREVCSTVLKSLNEV